MDEIGFELFENFGMVNRIYVIKCVMYSLKLQSEFCACLKRLFIEIKLNSKQ